MAELGKNKMNNPLGYCECGCGVKTKIYDYNHTARGYIKGEYRRFINHHQARKENNSQWNGGKNKTVQGYIKIKTINHPHRDSKGYVMEHILIAEKVLGKYLPINVIVHHINEDKTNNKNDNLVVCQDDNYHRTIHKRMKSLKECGNPNWEKCAYCKQYDDPDNLTHYKYNQFHKKCRNEYGIIYRLSKKIDS